MKNITRVFEFPQYQLEQYNLDKAFSTKYGDTWVSHSTKEFLETANKVSRGLIRLGIQADEKIAVISTTNRTEWNVMDIAVLQIGAQNVPIYPTICKEDYGAFRRLRLPQSSEHCRREYVAAAAHADDYRPRRCRERRQSVQWQCSGQQVIVRRGHCGGDCTAEPVNCSWRHPTRSSAGDI